MSKVDDEAPCKWHILLLAAITHSNLNTDSCRISFCNMEEDHETYVSDGLRLKGVKNHIEMESYETLSLV